MSINQNLASLYQSWKQSGQHFVCGGVVDEHMFETAEVKVMMLLKEVNDPEQRDDWSLVDLINDQIRNQHFLPIWRRVGEWSFGLEQGFPSYRSIVGHMDTANITSGLLNIATTNLKKSGGSGESDYEMIKKHALAEVELWTKEIEMIQPDVVICGGTFSIVREILGFDYQVCGSGACYGKALNTIFVDFYHPQYRISPKVLYAYFKETMRELGF
jgi:hypothetical protein